MEPSTSYRDASQRAPAFAGAVALDGRTAEAESGAHHELGVVAHQNATRVCESRRFP